MVHLLFAAIWQVKKMAIHAVNEAVKDLRLSEV
jgi:hypothetical protein